MLERLETWLKCACLVLAVLVALGIARCAFQSNPLAHVIIPSPPTLPADTNKVEVAKASNQTREPPSKGTNQSRGSVSVAAARSTNTVLAGVATGGKAEGRIAEGQRSTNSILIGNATNNSEAISNSTLAEAVDSVVKTNSLTNTAAVASAISSVSSSTNASADVPVTNAAGLVALKALSNSPAPLAAARGKTNSPAHKPSVAAGGDAMPDMPPEFAAMMGMAPAGAKLPELPPVIKARIDKITDSEILAAVMHPQPMALLGIAGNVAFLRSPSGQTGLIKESETLGELKLLRIGTNRVLVEQDGQKKELTIFSGYGGESLLPKPDTTHEPK